MNPTAAAPEVVASLDELRTWLRPWRTCPPADMVQLLEAHPDRFPAIIFEIVPPGDAPQPLVAATFRLLAAEGTVTTLVTDVLHRLHGLACSPVGPSSSTGPLPWSAEPSSTTPSPDAAIAAAFLHNSVLAPCVLAALNMCWSAEAVAAAAAFLGALAHAGLCSGLVETMVASQALLAPPNTPSTAAASAAARRSLAEVCASAAGLSLLLLQHGLQAKPACAALCADATQSCLLHHTCEAMSHLLAGRHRFLPEEQAAPWQSVRPAVRLSLVLLDCIYTAEAVDDGSASLDAAAAWRNSKRGAAMLAVAKEPAFPRMLVQALVCFHPESWPLPAAAAAEGFDDSNLLVLLQTLKTWHEVLEDTLGGELALPIVVAVGLTAEQVGAMALASADCSEESTAAALAGVYKLLPPREQLRAYPALGFHAGALLERLLEWYRSGGASDVFARGHAGSFGSAGAVDPGQCSKLAVELFASDFSGTPGLDERSKCVLHLGLLNKAEALLRLSAVAPPAGQQSSGPTRRGVDDADQQTFAASEACQCAMGCVAALLADPQTGLPAMAAYQSLLATTRKLMAYGTQTAAAAGPDEDIPDLVGCSPHHFLPSAVVGKAIHPQSLFSALPSAGPLHAAGRLAVRCCALQLLPPNVQALSAGWAPVAQPARPPTQHEEGVMVDNLDMLAQLQQRDLWDISIAAGVPGLLLGLLRAQRAHGVVTTPYASVHVVSCAMSCMAGSAESDAWLRAAGAAAVEEELEVWTQAGPGLKAAARGDGDALLAVQQLLEVASKLVSKCQVLPAVAPAYVAPTWDSCAITTVSDATAAGLEPFLGCWHRGCTNLGGDSEVALKLLLCSNCRLARYCSTACQKQAWTAGHRAACNAWRAEQAVAASPGPR